MIPLLDPLPITPFQNSVRGEVTIPGSKSITNRALLLAALCKKTVTLRGALFSEDTQIMAKALNDLGLNVTLDEAAGTMVVSDQENGFKNSNRVELFVGNAGTAARFLTALCAAAPRGVYELDGVPQMHRRPMRGLIEALRALGADIRCLRDEGFLPIEIHAKGLSGGKVSIDASESSQMLSALLMVMARAKELCEIHRAKSVREPFVNMTLLIMRQFGFSAGSNSENGTLWTMPSDTARNSLASSGGTYVIEADASSASYFLALPVLKAGGRLKLRNMPYPNEDSKENLQGDGYNFINVMRNLGAKIEPYHSPRESSGLREFLSWITPFFSETKSSSRTASKVSRAEGLVVSYGHASRSKGLAQEFREFSDTFLTLAAISPVLSAKKTIITGIAHTRKQETDRIHAMASQLKKIIGEEYVHETTDSLEISPIHLSTLKRRISAMKGPILIDTFNDHRVAMSFALLGCYDLKKNGKPWISIKDPGCCAKTFPNFFEVLEGVRKASDLS